MSFSRFLCCRFLCCVVVFIVVVPVVVVLVVVFLTVIVVVFVVVVFVVVNYVVFVVVVFWSQVSRVTLCFKILKWHSISHSLTKVRYRAARAAKYPFTHARFHS